MLEEMTSNVRINYIFAHSLAVIERFDLAPNVLAIYYRRGGRDRVDPHGDQQLIPMKMDYGMCVRDQKIGTH